MQQQTTIPNFKVISGVIEHITFQGHSNMIMSVAFSPDGRTIVSGSTDQSVKVWEVSTSECLYTLQGHTNWIMPIAFSPDGLTLASGGTDPIIKLWDITSGECLNTLEGHSSMVISVAFRPDGHLFASNSADQTVKVLVGSGNDRFCVTLSPISNRAEGDAQRKTQVLQRTVFAS